MYVRLARRDPIGPIITKFPRFSPISDTYQSTQAKSALTKTGILLLNRARDSGSMGAMSHTKDLGPPLS